MTTRPMSPRDCPRFDTCSAALCPLDRDWHRRAVDTTDATCPYLRETAKPDIRSRFAGRYDEPVLAAAFALREELARHPHPRYRIVMSRIDAAATTPSLIDQAERRSAQLASVRSRKSGTCDSDPTGISPGDGSPEVLDPL